jgi:hypothetical protein
VRETIQELSGSSHPIDEECAIEDSVHTGAGPCAETVIDGSGGARDRAVTWTEEAKERNRENGEIGGGRILDRLSGYMKIDTIVEIEFSKKR